MELKRKHEIKQMKEYLPGFKNGFSVPIDNSDLDKEFGVKIGPTAIGNISLSDAFEISGTKPILAQDIPITLTDYVKPKKVAQSTLAEQGGNIVTSAIGFAGATANAFGPVKGLNELLADAGTSYAAGAGFGYQLQNNVDYNREMDEFRKERTNNTLSTMGTGAALGASIGSIVPGLGTLFGGAIGGAVGALTGIFGGASRKRRLQRKMIAAEQSAQATNLFNRSSAHSDYLASQYNQEHAYTQDDLLYGADEGLPAMTLLPEYALKKQPVITSRGVEYRSPNARGAFGETLFKHTDKEISATLIKDGRPHEDTNLLRVEPETNILGSEPDKFRFMQTGEIVSFQDEALPSTLILEDFLRKNRYDKRYAAGSTRSNGSYNR